MSIQVTVRLPDDLVAFMDREVAADTVRSRAELVATALERERRRLAGVRDAEIYATTEPDPELEAWVAWSAAHPAPVDD